MASTISQPNIQRIETSVPAIAQAVVDVAAAAIVDIEALQVANSGRDWKDSVRFATTAALAANTRTGNVLLADANGALGAIDGVTPVVGDRCLIKNEGTGANNGIYTVTTLGSGGSKFSFTRATDADSSADVTSGLVVEVEEGAVNAGRVYELTTANPITLNTTALTFGAFAPGLTQASDLASTANGKGASLVGLEDPGGLWTAAQLEALALEIKTKALIRSARNVVFGNIADLAAYTVAASTTVNDNVLNVQGDRVLLVGQTTAAQNGLYVVGAVGGGTAALTRAADMPAGLALPPRSEVRIEEGGFYKGSTWQSTSSTAGGAVIATNDPAYYPKQYKQTVTLAAGTYKIGFGSTATPDEPLFLLAGAVVEITQNTAGTAGGAPTLTTEYQCPDATRVAGIPTAANIVINATVAAGTLNNADTSTLDVLITNIA